MELNIEKLQYGSLEKKSFNITVACKESVTDNAKVLCVNAFASCGRSEMLNNEVIIEGVVKYVAIIKVNDEIKKIEKNERFSINDNVSNVNSLSKMITTSSTDKIRGYIETDNLMLSCVVNVNSLILSQNEFDYINDLNEDYRKKENNVKIFNTTFVKFLRFSVTDKTELSPRLPEIDDILLTNSSVNVKEVHISAGQLIIGGEILYQTVYKTTDEFEPIVQVSDSMNFSQIIEINENTDKPHVFLDVEEINTIVKPNEQGEMRVIEYNICLTGYAFAGEYSDVNLISDAYSLKNKVNCALEQISYCIIENDFDSFINKNIRVKVPDGCNPILRINSLTFMPEVIESKIIDSKIISDCLGEVSVVYTASGTDETEGFNTFVNFEIVSENNLSENIENVFTKISLSDMQAFLISSNEIEIRAGVNLKHLPMYRFFENVIKDIELSEQTEFPEFGIIILNAKKGDTLWDICKTYGVDEEEIIKLNPQISEILDNGGKIYIFRKLTV